MNPFSLIILIALLTEFTLGLIANLLNLKSLKLALPASLEGIYPPDEYRRSQEYTRTVTRFEFVTGTFSLLLLLSFWFTHGFNFLDQIVRGWGLAPVVNGLLYIGILAAVSGLLMLPFGVYATFVIEERFGFNRTTPGTFLLDRLKGLGLVILLGAPLLTGILLLFQYAAEYAWLYCWLAVTALSLIIQFVAPAWILPLFSKFTPIESGELKETILNYAHSVDFPVKNISVTDGSRRSSKANAFSG